mgnify:FL=1
MGHMKDKKEQQTKNPYHTSYGLWNNISYICKNMVTIDRWFLILIPIGMICTPMLQYLWTFISKFVIDAITNEQGTGQLSKLLLIFIVLQLIAAMLNTYYGCNIWWRFIHARLCMIQKQNLKIMRINYEHLENPDVMDCYERAGQACNNNMNGVEGMMREGAEFLKSLAVVLVGLAIMGSLNLWMVLLVFAVTVLNFLFRNYTSRTAKKKVWDPLAPWWRKNQYMQNTTTDFAAAKDIRMFGLKDWLCDKYRDLAEVRCDAQRENERLWRNAGFVGAATWLVSQAGVYAYLIYQVIQGNVTIGDFTMYTASFATFFNFINELLTHAGNLLACSREVDDFRSFLDFGGGDEEDGGIPVPKLDSYEFTFKNVSFRYPKAEAYALKNLNLTVKAGERLAVVGLNGAGKSTFIKLLLRLYEPTEGEILLNGVNVKDYNRHDYYQVFAPVFQTVELFAFPLAENISMQAPDETDAKKAEECLQAAGLKEKLETLPKGVKTEVLKVIYDDGVDFSGGEKQKIALARALYKEAPVVVLDEPTAALDAVAESRLYEDFDKLIGGKTAVYISHRLSSTQFCNHVAMFSGGEMVEYGTHKSLLEQNGEYAKMFHIQAQYYMEESGEEADA